MNQEMAFRMEELKEVRNETVETEKENNLIKEEIKKMNKNISDIKV
jgi:hypothetical protein